MTEAQSIQTPPVDAILIVSFGGPEGRDDVLPFLENVLRGRNVPRERMLAVAEHYYAFGGVSPINQQTRDLIAALRAELDAHNIDLPIYWGNRNWHPMLADTLREMSRDGIQHALCFFASAYSSYSGCRQYREDLARASAEIDRMGFTPPHFSLLRKFYNHPGFIEPNAEAVQAAYAELPAGVRDTAPLLFTAHSIPRAMAQYSMYEAQLKDACALVAARAGRPNWRLVYQSRSGAPGQPWLEPDIVDTLDERCASGERAVVVAPIGFISDHMEVIFDLDTEAKQHADAMGMTMARAATVGTHPAFIAMIRELIVERITGSVEKRALGSRGPGHDVCPVNCCLPRALDSARPLAPAVAGMDSAVLLGASGELHREGRA